MKTLATCSHIANINYLPWQKQGERPLSRTTDDGAGAWLTEGRLWIWNMCSTGDF